MWFLLNPPGEATIHVLSVKDFEWLSKTYDLSLGKQRSIDPRHSSLLNHLRFYLPEMFPQLNKILFLDHDVVVQKDLSGLFMINMKDKVNGAVETCHKGESSYRQMDMFINFSDPWVARNVDANSCTWAFGMNLFDLSRWRHKDLTASYRRLLLMVCAPFLFGLLFGLHLCREVDRFTLILPLVDQFCYIKMDASQVHL